LLNLNAKAGKWNEFAEFLRICVNQPCSKPFLIIFETKLEEMPESKSVAKCRATTFILDDFKV